MDARDVPPRFAVAFSYAGEDREVVLPIAQEVEAILGRGTVFFDRWFEFWTAGNNADRLLQELYEETSELVVVCVSGSYGAKEWTLVEHEVIRARLQEGVARGDRNDVLPLRVGEGGVGGIPRNALVPDVRGKTTYAASLIVARLGLVRGASGSSADDGSRWPVAPPDLDWPVADHTEVRDAFAAVLVESSPVRALFVQGPSGSGKTHVSKQMVRGCASATIACGRLDLKGTTDIDVQCSALALPLELDPPPNGPLTQRLGGILTQLLRRARPTVLVVDTYETAGEVALWMEDVLLHYLVTAGWLRVVVVGQRVPQRLGAVWEDVTAPPLGLRPPGPEDWYAYHALQPGKKYSLDKVRVAHEMAGDRPWILAAMLGPSS